MAFPIGNYICRTTTFVFYSASNNRKRPQSRIIQRFTPFYLCSLSIFKIPKSDIFMEISSVPFLTSEDFSYFYNNSNIMFPEMYDEDVFGVNLSPIDDSKKRRRLEDEVSVSHKKQSKSSDIKGILTSLLLLEDEEEKQEQSQREFRFSHQKNLIDTNFESEALLMADFGRDTQQHYSQASELDQSRALKVRRAASSSSSAAATAAFAAGEESRPGIQRRLWVKDRSKDWWEQRDRADFPEEKFKKDFRMSKATFQFICQELDSAVTKKNTMLRDAVPVRQRVAVCIWRLATGEPLRLVSKRFGLGISTCHKLVLEVCSAIKSILMPKFVSWPSEKRMGQAKEAFEVASGIKDVAGAMYTTHIPIIAPKENVSAYFNRRHTERNQKTSYSITVQGVVDGRGVFSDICVGWPGSMPDEEVLGKSAIFRRAEMGEMRDHWVVGGPGYPLLDWVLVPYSRQNLTWAQHAFNERVGEVRKSAKDAFARLKGRWSCLQKRTEVKLQDLPVVLGACCTLHNICEMRGEEIDEECRVEIFDDEMVATDVVSGGGPVSQKRDQIAHNLLHHSLAGTSFL